MKKTTWIPIGIIAVIVMWAISVQHKLVAQEEVVKKAWAQVETDYQRRADLVPGLQAIVQGAANYESSTLTAVIEARSKASSINIDADQLTEENIAAFQKAQDKLTDALHKSIQLTVERYPELTATQGFRDFQAQYEGCENRIAVARNKFTESVQTYNTTIRQFPTSILASLFGFEKKGQFTAAEGADVAPKIEFN